MVLVALWLPAILVMVGLLYTLGFIFVQRRALQASADAASTASAWTLLYELKSGDRRDAAVLQQLQAYAAQAAGASASAVYTDAAGSPLSPSVAVGSGSTFPSAARGIQVRLQTTVSTLLVGSTGISGVLTAATSTSALVPTTSPSPTTLVVPVAVNVNDLQLALNTGATYDLLAPSTLPSGATSPILDFAHSSAAAFAPGGQPPDYGYSQRPPRSDDTTGPSSIFTNLQYWSDGRHTSATLALGSAANLALAPSAPLANSAFVDPSYTAQQVTAYRDALVAGLLDNLSQQGLTDTSGRAYGIVVVPVWDTSPSAGTVHVAGGALLRLRVADVNASSAPGQFVVYPAAAWGVPQPPTVDLGACLVRLVS